MNPEIQKVIAGESEGCVVCADSQEIMADMLDNCVDLCLTDPPYGIKIASNGNVGGNHLAMATDYGNTKWDNDSLSQQIIDEIKRISKEQVIFGGNYIADKLPPSSSWIVWDKENGECNFADCELAWTSHKKAVRMFRYRWAGMLQGDMKNKEYRFHPTQKPVPLMVWILKNYTQQNDIIFDGYAGSGTCGVAAKSLGRRYILIEQDERYCQIARNRIASQERPLFA